MQKTGKSWTQTAATNVILFSHCLLPLSNCLPSVRDWSDWFQSSERSSSPWRWNNVVKGEAKKQTNKKSSGTLYRKSFRHTKNQSYDRLWWSFVAVAAAGASVITVITSSAATENRRRCSTVWPGGDESNDLFCPGVPSFFLDNCISSHRFSSIYI